MCKASGNREKTIRLLNQRLSKHGFAPLQQNTQQRNVDYSSVHDARGIRLNFNIRKRLWIEKSFIDNHVLMVFSIDETLFVYDHDRLIEHIRKSKPEIVLTTRSWRDQGLYDRPHPPKWVIDYILGVTIEGVEQNRT